MTIEIVQGVVRHFGPRVTTDGRMTEVHKHGDAVELQVTFDAEDLPIGGSTTDLTLPSVPADSIIESAEIETLTVFTTSDAAALNVGLEQADGTEIDDNGIDAAVAVTAIDRVGERVVCDGALIGTSIGSAVGQLKVYETTGTFTAGRARLTLRIKPPHGV